MKAGRERLFGVKLIAAFFLVKTLVFSSALVVAHISLRSEAAALGLIEQLAPPLQLLNSQMALLFAPAFIIFGLVIIFGVWFLQGWAWALLFVDCGIPLVRLAQFFLVASIVDRKWLSFLPSSPYFAIDVVSSIFIVAYLLQPEVMRAFGDTT
jgi:hypothetical protein